MAVLDYPITNAPANGAALRTMIQTILDHLEDNGLPQLELPGSLVVADIPDTLSNATYGYTVHAFSDSLQAQLPVFFRFQWEISTTRVVVRVRVGLSLLPNSIEFVPSLIVGSQIILSWSSYTVGDSGVFISCAPNRIGIFFWPRVSFSPTGHFISIERGHNSQGQDISDYISIRSSHDVFYGYAGRNGAIISATGGGTLMCFAPYNLTTSMDAGDIFAYPNYPYRGGEILQPVTSYLIGYRNDWADKQVFSIQDPYGQTRDYKAFHTDAYVNPISGQGNNQGMVLLRWD
jgi:hypothetical protein